MSMSTSIITANKGNNGLITLVTGTLATPLPTNNKVPTGGVHRPMHKFKTMIIPNCTGCMPKVIATGRKIGVKIRTAGVISIKVPTISKIIFIIRKMTMGLLTLSNSVEVNICGIPSKENNHDMAIEVEIKNITTAVVLALLSKMGLKSETKKYPLKLSLQLFYLEL